MTARGLGRAERHGDRRPAGRLQHRSRTSSRNRRSDAGLRLDVCRQYHVPSTSERVDVIGNQPHSCSSSSKLQREEDIALDSVGPHGAVRHHDDRGPDPAKLDRDIAVPVLSPMLARKKTLAVRSLALDVQRVPTPPRLPIKTGRQRRAAQRFHYEGVDVITLQKRSTATTRSRSPRPPRRSSPTTRSAAAQDVKLPVAVCRPRPEGPASSLGRRHSVEYVDLIDQARS